MEDTMLKKIALFSAASLILLQGAAFAATDVTAGGSLVVPTGMPAAGSTITKLSNNVVARVVASANQFSAIAKHINGTKNYATATSDTKVFMADVTTNNKGTATFEITLSASDTSDFASWSSL